VVQPVQACKVYLQLVALFGQGGLDGIWAANWYAKDGDGLALEGDAFYALLCNKVARSIQDSVSGACQRAFVEVDAQADVVELRQQYICEAPKVGDAAK